MAEAGAALAAGDTGAGAVAAAGGNGATAPWYQGLAGVDQEVVGHWTNAGWINKTAAEVALEATKSWKAAERYVGVPANQVLRIPKDAADEAGWKQVWSRLGKPAEAKDYDFSAIKGADGSAPDENFTNAAREWAFKNNLPKDTAASITQEFAKFLDQAKTTERTEKAAKLIEQKEALKKNWGPNEAANMFVAQRAAAALGVRPEDVSALESVVGYDRVMEMFRAIGSRIGEDKFITSTAPGNASGVMTREQAVAQKANLMGDTLWRDAYLKGDAAKLREMTALNTIIIAPAA